MNARAQHRAGSAAIHQHANHLPLLWRRLRRVGHAGRPAAALRSQAIPTIRRISGGCARKDRRWARRLALETRLLHPMLRRATARLRVSRGTTALDHVAAWFADTHRAKHGPDVGRLLSVRAVADRRLLRRQQADEGLHRLRQCRHQFAAVHGVLGRRPHAAPSAPTPCRAPTTISTAPISSSWSAPMRPGAIRSCFSGCRQQARARREDRRHRSAPHRDRRERRSVPAVAPGMDTALFCGLLVHLADTLALDYEFIDAHTSGLTEALVRAREIAPDLRRDGAGRRASEATSRGFFELFATTERRHLLLAGREPVGAGHRQGQRDHQLPSRHRADRQARHGAVLAHRPAQRHGRTRGGRAGQPARRAYGLLRRRRSTASAASGTRAPWPRSARPQGRRMFEAIERGEIKALWVMATNPAVCCPTPTRCAAP